MIRVTSMKRRKIIRALLTANCSLVAWLSAVKSVPHKLRAKTKDIRRYTYKLSFALPRK